MYKHLLSLSFLVAILLLVGAACGPAIPRDATVTFETYTIDPTTEKKIAQPVTIEVSGDLGSSTVSTTGSTNIDNGTAATFPQTGLTRDTNFNITVLPSSGFQIASITPTGQLKTGDPFTGLMTTVEVELQPIPQPTTASLLFETYTVDSKGTKIAQGVEIDLTQGNLTPSTTTTGTVTLTDGTGTVATGTISGLMQGQPFSFTVPASSEFQIAPDSPAPPPTTATNNTPTPVEVKLQPIQQQPPTTTFTFTVASSSSAKEGAIPDNTPVMVNLTNTDGTDPASSRSGQANASGGTATIPVVLIVGAAYSYTVSANAFNPSQGTLPAGSTNPPPVTLNPSPVNVTVLTGQTSVAVAGTTPVPASLAFADPNPNHPPIFVTTSAGAPGSTAQLAAGPLQSVTPGTLYNIRNASFTNAGGQTVQAASFSPPSFTPLLAGQGNHMLTIIFDENNNGMVNSLAVKKVSNKGKPQSATPSAQPAKGTPIKALPPPR
jgi:hypothetical protein